METDPLRTKPNSNDSTAEKASNNAAMRDYHTLEVRVSVREINESAFTDL